MQEGWDRVTLDMLAKILGPAKLLDLKHIDKMKGRLRILTNGPGLLKILRSLK